MPTYPEIDPQKAHAKIAEFRIIDVREPHEFEGPSGHIRGAELVPLDTLSASAEPVDALRGSEPVLLVCRSGRRSGIACELLQQRGISDVANLAGGMIEWTRLGLPVECEPQASDAPRPGDPEAQ